MSELHIRYCEYLSNLSHSLTEFSLQIHNRRVQMASADGAEAVRSVYVENADQRASNRRGGQQIAVFGQSEARNRAVVRRNRHFGLLPNLLLL